MPLIASYESGFRLTSQKRNFANLYTVPPAYFQHRSRYLLAHELPAQLLETPHHPRSSRDTPFAAAMLDSAAARHVGTRKHALNLVL